MSNSFKSGAESSFEEFLNSFPEYSDTTLLDEIRSKEFKRLDDLKHVYLDYTGGNLYPECLLDQHHEMLKNNIYGNPHSTNHASQWSTELVEDARNHVLKHFNAADDYFCIFTSNTSGALKIIGESYPFDADSYFLLTIDNHNSVNGIREFAKNKHSSFSYSPLDAETLFINQEKLIENLDKYSSKKNKLFAFPAQSNVSGIKHPLEYIKLAQNQGWDVLLDTAAFVPTNKLDLQIIKPNYACVSFYKIFGYPTGIGCLLVRKDSFLKLEKPWFAGGTISVTSATYDAYYLQKNHERFEDGTINYLGIPAIKNGLQFIEQIGIDKINIRVKCLTGWLLQQLAKLKHSNGNSLIKIFGSTDLKRKGGTIFMNFYDKNGHQYSFRTIEELANKENISIRSGCFCNPGIDETTNHIGYAELENYFTTHTDGNFDEMIDFSGKLRGSVRVSTGIASNFNDANSFVNFARSFIDKAISS